MLAYSCPLSSQPCSTNIQASAARSTALGLFLLRCNSSDLRLRECCISDNESCRNAEKKSHDKEYRWLAVFMQRRAALFSAVSDEIMKYDAYSPLIPSVFFRSRAVTQ